MIPASDTPQPDAGKQPERHCDHECMCYVYRKSVWEVACDDRPVCSIEMQRKMGYDLCRSDTRSRPITPAPEQIITVLGIPLIFPTGMLERVVKFKVTLDQHDAALIQRTLDCVATEIMKATGIDTPRHFDPNDYVIPSLGIDELAEIINKIRSQPPTTGSITSPAKGCDSCDHWDMCEGCPYTDERRPSKGKEE